eukprot:NODE_250_length_11764_cov_1.155594.p7 type:complete len:106 gc:universal NODE_250_length_11764_cov_1.155594:6979-6662(-)
MINRHFKPDLLSLEDEYGDFFVVQDNAPIHTSKHTTEYLEDLDMTFIDWPAKSPDMNVIELMWRELRRRMKKSKKYLTSLTELEQLMVNCWSEIPSEFIQRLIDD